MRGVAADLFIGDEEDVYWARQSVFVPGTKSLDGVKHKDDAGLHVEASRAPGAAVGNTERHGVQGAERVDGIQMTEQHDGLGRTFAGKINLQMIAKFCGLMKLRMSAETFEATGQERTQAIDGLLVIAGRFDFDQLANGLDHLLAALFEKLQAGREVRLRRFGGLLLP